MLDAPLVYPDTNRDAVALPVFNPWELWKTSKSGTSSRALLEADAWIHHDGDNRLEPMGLIYTLPSNGRQLYVPIAGRQLQLERARYLIGPLRDLAPSGDGQANLIPFSKLKPHDKAVSDVFGDTPGIKELTMLRDAERASRERARTGASRR
jgi:hypothetical protein